MHYSDSMIYVIVSNVAGGLGVVSSKSYSLIVFPSKNLRAYLVKLMKYAKTRTKKKKRKNNTKLKSAKPSYY